jgi:hypothetical protein
MKRVKLLGVAFVAALSLISGSAAANMRPVPLHPEAPPTPESNPQLYQPQAPVFVRYPVVVPPTPTTPPVPPQQTSNRCFFSPTQYGTLSQWAPIGTACWLSDDAGNIYNGVIR